MSEKWNEYLKKYNNEKLVCVSLKLSKKNDADIIKHIDLEKKSESIKALIRKGIKSDENR